jgi:hypothetical protein
MDARRGHRLFGFSPKAADYAPWGAGAAAALFVGRVSYEKNIQAFLELDLPGTKVVCGVGPVEDKLRARFPAGALAGRAAAR